MKIKETALQMALEDLMETKNGKLTLPKIIQLQRCFQNFNNRPEEERLARLLLDQFYQNVKTEETAIQKLFEGFIESENEKMILQEILEFQRCFQDFYNRVVEERLAVLFYPQFSQNIKTKETALQKLFEVLMASEIKKMVLQEILEFQRCFQHLYNRVERERLAELLLDQYLENIEIKETALQKLFEGLMPSEIKTLIVQEILELKRCFQNFNNRPEEERLARLLLDQFYQNIKTEVTVIQKLYEGFIESENEKMVLQEILEFQRCFQHLYNRVERERHAELLLDQYLENIEIKETALQKLFEGLMASEIKTIIVQEILELKRCFQNFNNRPEEERLARLLFDHIYQNIKTESTVILKLYEGFIESENEKMILQEILEFQRCFQDFYNRVVEERCFQHLYNRVKRDRLAELLLDQYLENIEIKETALQKLFEGLMASGIKTIIVQEILELKRCFQDFYNRLEGERLAVLFFDKFLKNIEVKETAPQSFKGLMETENKKVTLQEISVLKKGGPTAFDKPEGEHTEEGNKVSKATSEMKDISAAKPDQNRNLRKAVKSNTLVKEEKRLTGLKAAFRKVKKADKLKETWERERLHTESRAKPGIRAKPGAKIKWSVHSLALTFTLSQFTMLYLAIGLMAQIASASFSCAENQTAELGERGKIVCTFPDSFHAVYWYDDVRDGSSPLITYTHHREDKTEFCMENESYDVSENGSLIICNVAVWHEKNYTVIMYTNPIFFEELTVFVKVIAFPGNRSTTVQCENCHKGRYHRVDTNGSLSCSFKVARPAVVIEWVQRYPQGDSLISSQEVNITNNANGTYNTTADVHLVAKIDKQIAVFVCKATYPSSGWKREREILLDFSHGGAFSSEPISTTYMETRKRAELRCGGSDHIIRMWKLVLTTGDSETIGFRFGDSTEMTKNISGIEITSEGSLIFSSPQIQHEGEYVCVYSDGIKDRLQKTAVVVLIAPSPPYIRITGCNDAEYNCVLKEEKIQELTCTVDGVYPNATLEWVPKNPSQISFYNYSTLYEKNGLTYDISASVKLVVSPDLHCEDEIYIECRLHGPASRVMKAERSARLTPKTCMAKTDDRDHQLTILIQLHVLEMLVVVLYAITITYFVIHRRNHRGSIQTDTNVQTSRKGSIETDTNCQTSRKDTNLENSIRSRGSIQKDANGQTSRKGTKMEKGIESQDAGENFALTRSHYRETMEQDVLLQEDENTLALSI